MAMIPLANTMVLFYTFPLFVALFSFLLYGERVGKWELLLILIGVIGIYIVVNPHSYHFNVGYVFALLAGSIGALAMVFTHELRKTNGPLIIYFYFCLVGGVLSLPFYGMDFRLPDLQQLLFLILVGIISLIGQLLMNQGFKYCKAAEGSAILMAEVIFAGIAGTLIFRDPLTLNFLIGALFVIGSGVGLNLLYRRPRTPSVSPKD
jgi:drug/metabolite transporter (DMT)-like permease